MRQVTRKGLLTVAAAGGVLAITGGSALADATADGGAEHSPGVLSGNTVQAPVHVPVNACGNTANLVGLLNPAFGNTCVNKGGDHGPDSSDSGHEGGGSTAEGGASNSPGVGSGNVVQVPVDVPVNACGNGVNVGSLLNPTFGNECVNDSGETWEEPPADKHEPEKTPEEEPKDTPDAPKTQTVAHPELAETGAGYQMETVLGMGASLLLGGTVLYRRARAAQR
jgi:hypothetical protein